MKNSVRYFTLKMIQKALNIIKNRLKTEAPTPKICADPQHKVGDIPRWSVPPVLTCGGNCKHCEHNCYALKDYFNHRVASVSKNHARNMNAVVKEFQKTEEYLIKWIAKHSPTFFRIHPSGDFAIPGMGNKYAEMWYRVAQACPSTRFLAFTKCFDIVRNVPFYELENFSLVLSEWTDVLKAPEDLKEHYRTSRAVENIEDARPNEIICPGNCETCGMCWALKMLGHDIAFEIH